MGAGTNIFTIYSPQMLLYDYTAASSRKGGRECRQRPRTGAACRQLCCFLGNLWHSGFLCNLWLWSSRTTGARHAGLAHLHMLLRPNYIQNCLLNGHIWQRAWAIEQSVPLIGVAKIAQSTQDA